MKYAIRQKFTYGWDFAPWSIDGEPNFIFDTREEAQKEISNFLHDMEIALEAGDIIEAYSASQFSIMEVLDKNVEDVVEKWRKDNP